MSLLLLLSMGVWAESPSEAETSVVIAQRTLTVGVAINEADLVAVVMPKRYVPAGAFDSLERVVGRVPLHPMYRNQIVREASLLDPQTGSATRVLPVGWRAVGVPLAGASLSPESYVDVWAGGGPERCAVVQSARVLFLADPSGRPVESAATLAILAVPAREALRILKVVDTAGFELTVRPASDLEPREEVACSW